MSLHSIIKAEHDAILRIGIFDGIYVDASDTAYMRVIPHTWSGQKLEHKSDGSGHRFETVTVTIIIKYINIYCIH